MKPWTSRKTPIGTIQPVTGVNGETFIAILGSKPLASQSFGITPAKAREVAAALTAAADEVDAALAAPAQDGLWSG